MTGSEGMKHTQRMLDSGTNVVGGVNPRKAGETVDFADGSVPVFGTVAEAMAETGADVSVVFVPPAFTKAAAIEAIDAGIAAASWSSPRACRCTTPRSSGRTPQAKGTTRIIGPNCPGLISPGKSNAGIIPADITKAGRVGLVSKSGTLTYQMMYELRDFGFSSAVGIGGDPIIGTTHIDALAAFEADPETDAIVMIGEIGGDAEERAAAYIKDHVTKPVVGYVAGFTAPEGKTMGHAGAIVSGSSGTAAAKKDALEAVGVKVGKTPSETAELMREILRLTSAPHVAAALGHSGRVARERSPARRTRAVNWAPGSSCGSGRGRSRPGRPRRRGARPPCRRSRSPCPRPACAPATPT